MTIFHRHSLSRIVALALSIFAAAACSASEFVLHSFNQAPHGASPGSPLIADAAGNLYGTGYGLYTGLYNSAAVVFKLSPTKTGAWSQTVLHTFVGNAGAYPDGQSPVGNLVFDSSGNLYGVTAQGGEFAGGTVYKLSPSSGTWKETIIFNFDGVGTGGYPEAGLIFDGSGNLYGTTSIGGNGPCDDSNDNPIGCGVVFELSPGTGSTWTEHILHAFMAGNDGNGPHAPLTLDAAGNLYGTTVYGGNLGTCNEFDFPYDCGLVFRMTPNGDGTWNEVPIYVFQNQSDGGYPYSGVIFDSAGNLYGQFGLPWYSDSAVFELSPSSSGTWTEATIYSPALVMDNSTLVIDPKGNIYGTTESDYYGTNYGTVFELSPSQGTWTATTIYQFTGGTDGAQPQAGVLRDAAGNLYLSASHGGVANIRGGSGSILKLSPSSSGTWIDTVLYDFPFVGDGDYPQAGLIADAAGNLYGTTQYGGTAGWGTVFKMSRNSSGKWQTTILYNFTDANGDGGFPLGTLVFDSAGNLYGTTEYGGLSNGSTCYYGGCGTVFELSPGAHGQWVETILYNFYTVSGSKDGADPKGGLVIDNQGNLYGTTPYGGVNQGGTVFKLSPGSGGWTETILYSFYNFSTNGDQNPSGSLLFDAKGNLYGTDQDCVFELSPINATQWQETVLHVFSGTGSDGEFPYGALAIDAAGNLYGTANYGGLNKQGIVYQLVPGAAGWTENVLYNFKGVDGDGGRPQAGVILDAAGNLFGTTADGGSYTGLCSSGCGTAFKLFPSFNGWKEKVLYDFSGGTDGSQPVAPLLLGSAGTLYGTAPYGGTGGTGIVFEIKP